GARTPAADEHQDRRDAERLWTHLGVFDARQSPGAGHHTTFEAGHYLVPDPHRPQRRGVAPLGDHERDSAGGQQRQRPPDREPGVYRPHRRPPPFPEKLGENRKPDSPEEHGDRDREDHPSVARVADETVA